jgi:hypothetical protein
MMMKIRIINIPRKKVEIDKSENESYLKQIRLSQKDKEEESEKEGSEEIETWSWSSLTCPY